jgi:hypothetical protein
MIGWITIRLTKMRHQIRSIYCTPSFFLCEPWAPKPLAEEALRSSRLCGESFHAIHSNISLFA